MIEKLTVSALKSIDNLQVECKKMNLFVGTNSSGKSSTLQALLLMMQNIESITGLNGPLISIGEYREARNYNTKTDEILINIESNHEKIGLTLNEKSSGIISGDVNCDLAKKINYSNGHVHYLSCNRIGSQDVYAKNVSTLSNTGINGQYAIDYLCKYKDEPLEKSLVRNEDSFTFLSQVNYWLKYIVGATIKAEEITGTDVVKASYGVVENRYSRPKNVGSGISYLISIIISCLGSKRGDILLIENPEIHLHPLSQSRTCEFLYFVSQAGRQLFVETHSDHIFNAIRVGIAKKEIISENVGIHFFRLGSDNCTRVEEVLIGGNGKIVNPLPNLFDQFEVDLNKMLGI